MGLMGGLFNVVFGAGNNVVRETAEVFRENAEAASARETGLQQAAIEAFAAEFAQTRRGWFDRFMDGMNRVPRPALALSTLGLFLAAMVDPAWFASRMEGVALVPEPLWWLMGAIVSFYFGARHQVKGQEFQQSIAETLAAARRLRNRDSIGQQVPPASLPSGDAPASAKPETSGQPIAPDPITAPTSKVDASENAALRDWQESRLGQ